MHSDININSVYLGSEGSVRNWKKSKSCWGFGTVWSHSDKKSAREPENENPEECSSPHLAAFQVRKAAVLEHLYQQLCTKKASFSEFFTARKTKVPKLQFSHCQTWNSLPGTITFCSCLAPCCLATIVASVEATGEKSPFQSGARVGIIRSGNYLLTS